MVVSAAPEAAVMAQPAPATVAQPPRMVPLPPVGKALLLSQSALVTEPKSTVPPTLRVMVFMRSLLTDAVVMACAPVPMVVEPTTSVCDPLAMVMVVLPLPPSVRAAVSDSLLVLVV